MKFFQCRRHRTVVKYLLRIMIPLFLILCIIIYGIYLLQIKNEKQLIKIRQQKDVQLLKYDLEYTLNSVFADFKVIKDSNEVNDYIHNANSENLDKMQRMFERYAINKKIYRSIKFVDLQGKVVASFQKKEDLAIDKAFMEFKIDVEGRDKQKLGQLVFEYESEYLWKKVIGYIKNNEEFAFALINHDEIIFTQGNYVNISDGKEVGYTENKEGIYYIEDISPFKGKEQNIYVYGEDVQDNWTLVSYFPKNKLNLIKEIWFKGVVGIIIIFIIIIILLSYISAVIIYKRKKAVKRLRVAMNIIENSGEAIIFTDANTNIIYVNKTFCKITGYLDKEVVGLKTSYFKSGKHSKEFYKKMWTTIINQGRWQGEIWDKRKNGKIYPKFLTIIAVNGDHRKVSGYIGIFKDLSDIKNKEERIKKLKNYDTITSLPNESLMKKIFKRRFSNVDNLNGKNIYIISIIISNYDTVKNSLGVNIMDNLMLQLTERIRENCKEECLLSRMSSHEFLILMREKNNKCIILQFSKLITNALKAPFIIKKQSVYLKGDIGISIYPKDSNNIDELVEKANIARAYAKDIGEYNVVMYEQGLRDKYLKAINIENLLRSAIERGEIYLEYQPQVKLKNEKIVGAEALIRWKSHEMGMVYPNQFIPIAENTDMIIPIGKWVIEESCKNLSLWINEYNRHITIAVNISPIQFKKSDMYKTIKEILEKYNLPGHCLEIEITEGVLIDNINNIQKQLKSIRELGVKMAMDDFGTGYSSLSYLRRFHFDKVKIDREFVKDYPEKEDGTLAKTIINLSHSLKLKVLAEGVETEEQIEFMKKNSCDEIQGYYYSPPVTEDKFQELLKKDM